MNAVFERCADIGCDSERIVAIGGSAGGHLALATAVLDLPNTNTNTNPDQRPAARPVQSGHENVR